MGCWLQAKQGKPFVRDGDEITDPKRRLGLKPVWFENIDGARYDGNPEITVRKDLADPPEAERRRLAAQTEEERLAEAAGAKPAPRGKAGPSKPAEEHVEEQPPATAEKPFGKKT